MPSESGHQLEPLLRGWAKKRREEHKPEFELHPATRRLLLGEVARLYPKRAEARVPWRIALGHLWARAAGVVGLLLVLGVAAWAFKYTWSNLARYTDIALDAQNPPKQIAFSLRKRPVQKDEKSRTNAPEVTGRVSQLKTLAEATPASPSLNQPKAAPVLPAAPGMEFSVGGAAGAREEELVRLGRRPTNAAPSEVRKALGFLAIPPTGDGFSPELSPLLATGGVAAFTESLARTPSGEGRDAKKGLGIPAGEAAGAVALATSSAPATPPALQLRERELAKAETAPAAPAAAGAPLGGAFKPAVEGKEGSVEHATVLADLTADRTSRSLVAAPPAKAVERFPAATAAKPDAPVDRLAQPSSGSLAFARVTEARALDSVALYQPGGIGMGGKTAEVSLRGELAGKERGATVLNRFELKQDGVLVTLTDADGSVYEGAVTLLAADKSNADDAYKFAYGGLARTTGPRPQAQPAPANEKPAASAGAVLASAAESRVPLYELRAWGTNRTLNERVAVSAIVSSVPGLPSAGLNGTQGAVAEEKASYATQAPETARMLRSAPMRAAPDRQREAGRAGAAPPADKRTLVRRITLEGHVRIGTNAEQPLKAVEIR